MRTQTAYMGGAEIDLYRDSLAVPLIRKSQCLQSELQIAGTQLWRRSRLQGFEKGVIDLGIQGHQATAEMRYLKLFLGHSQM